MSSWGQVFGGSPGSIEKVAEDSCAQGDEIFGALA